MSPYCENCTLFLRLFLKDCTYVSPGKPAIINKFTLIVQEYFQLRVNAWLENVGKDLLGIKHHWFGYEFPPSRGQIHAHMLVICDNKEVVKTCLALKHDKPRLAAYLSARPGDTLGVTSNINKNWSSLDMKSESHPSTIKFGGLHDDVIEKDVTKCQLSFQKHKCSKYCMRDRLKTKKTIPWSKTRDDGVGLECSMRTSRVRRRDQD